MNIKGIHIMLKNIKRKIAEFGSSTLKLKVKKKEVLLMLFLKGYY